MMEEKKKKKRRCKGTGEGKGSKQIALRSRLLVFATWEVWWTSREGLDTPPVGRYRREVLEYCSLHGDCRTDVHCTACHSTKSTSKQQQQEQRDRYRTPASRRARNKEPWRSRAEGQKMGWDGMGQTASPTIQIPERTALRSPKC